MENIKAICDFAFFRSMKIQNVVIGLDLKQKYREHSPYSKLKQIYNKYHFTALNKNELPLKKLSRHEACTASIHCRKLENAGCRQYKTAINPREKYFNKIEPTTLSVFLFLYLCGYMILLSAAWTTFRNREGASYKEEKNSENCIRIEYANVQADNNSGK